MKFLKLKNCNCCYQTLFYNDWTTCFNWKYSKKTRKLSKNDKFVTNKTIFFILLQSICFYGIKTKLSVDSFYFSCIFISFQKTSWMRVNNATAKKKMKKSETGNMPLSDFFQFSSFCFFQWFLHLKKTYVMICSIIYNDTRCWIV